MQKQKSKEKIDKKEEEAKPPKTYTYQDLIKFSGTEIYSSMGPMLESVKPSAPLYSFGSSVKAAEPKKYVNKQMAKSDCFGKQTPQGPNYNPTDKFNYSSSPNWRFGTAARNTLDTQAKYEHYHRKDVDLDINEADKSKRFNIGNARIGGEPRFPPEMKKYKMTPGPQYDPSIRPEIPHSPKYSLYDRRCVKGFDPLMQLNSTPPIVGPGSYHPEHASHTSQDVNKPAWSLPKGPRFIANRNKWDLNQTYDVSSSVGVQNNSQKQSLPHFSTGKAQRDNPTGIFKHHMEYRPIQVRIPHPSF